MEGLIIIGIIIAIVIIRHLAVHGKLGDEIDTGLNDRIALNEIKADMTIQTGGVDNNMIQEMKNDNQNTNALKWETLNLMQNILTEIGCQPNKRNENELTVDYQGEKFLINTGGAYAQIWDLGWANIDVKDPNYEKMKTAANLCNFDFGPTIVFTTPNEDGVVWLHTKHEIALFPNIPQRNDYMRSVFDSFFDKKERMRGQFHFLINQQQQSPKHHRPVGFATSDDEN